MAKGLESIAYHEAGHVVAEVRLEFFCNGASIVPGRRWLDIAKTAEGPEARPNDSVTVFLAGYAAEVEHNPASKPHATVDAADDFAKAASILGQGQSFNSRLVEARDFVKKNWKAIEIVARELLDVKALDGDEVSLIVGIADGKAAALQDLSTHRRAIEGYLKARRGRAYSRQFPGPRGAKSRGVPRPYRSSAKEVRMSCFWGTA